MGGSIEAGKDMVGTMGLITGENLMVGGQKHFPSVATAARAFR